jgi:hypothetical protein
METHRLQKLVDPRQAQILIDAYVSTAASLPSGARQQSDLARLPLAFQDCAEQAQAKGQVWSAWTRGGDAWLFVGQLNLDRARERGQPVLEIDTYDSERHTKSRRVVLRSPDGTWQLLWE